MEVSNDLLSDVNNLISKGHIEKSGDTLILTRQGREVALLRWRGLCADAQILCSLWLKERYDTLEQGGNNGK